MMALLLLIGQKLEAPEIIDQLLDVQSNPRKPQYRCKVFFLHFQGFLVIGTSLRYILFPVGSMAVDYPLVLYDCRFEGLSWRREEDEVNHVLSALQQQWTQCAVRSHVLKGMIQGLEAIGGLFDGTKRYLKG